jgi:hypothetical protein
MGGQTTSFAPMYWQCETRAEAYARRASLFSENVEELKKAGRLADAAEAAWLRAAGPEIFAPSTSAWYEADEQMDAARDLLAQLESARAMPFLKLAAKTYRAAGSLRSPDFADALWNLGYAISTTDGSHAGLMCLLGSAHLLHGQIRSRDWIRCAITILANRLDNGEWELPDIRAAIIVDLCVHFDWNEELLDIELLTARQLAQTQSSGDRVLQVLHRCEQMAQRLGPVGLDKVRRCQDACQSGYALQKLVRQSPLSSMPETTHGLESNSSQPVGNAVEKPVSEA